MSQRTILRVGASILSLFIFHIGCVDKPGSDTGDAVLYVYDQSSGSILSWKDVSALYDNGTATADRTISIASKVNSSKYVLSWGGMALDTSGQFLYLVSTTGQIIRISKIGTRTTGDVGTNASDIVSFKLVDSGSIPSGGVFGQASVDSSGSPLYVTETDSSGQTCRIWVVQNPSKIADGVNPTLNVIGNTNAESSGGSQALNDNACKGVTAGTSGVVYAYFDSGDTLTLPSDTSVSFTGSRLRKGTHSGGFTANANVIAGKKDSGNSLTQFGPPGCLAYDRSNDYLYFGLISSSGTEPSVLMFKPGDFDSGVPVEHAPESTFAGPSNLRIITHAGLKDWLVGAEVSTTDATVGTNLLWIWKGPSSGDTHKSISLGSTVQIKGLALDGSN